MSNSVAPKSAADGIVEVARRLDEKHEQVAGNVESVSMCLGVASGIAAAGAALAAPTGLSAAGVALGVTSAPLIVAAAPVIGIAATVVGAVSGGVYFYSKWKTKQARASRAPEGEQNPADETGPGTT